MNQELTIQPEVKERGFTLIEILFVLSVTAIISTIGVAGFVSYSRSQKLNAAVGDVVSMLTVAKSRALSQVKPSMGVCASSVLDGYRVRTTGSSTYSLDVLCVGGSQAIQSKILPSNIAFANNKTFVFPILTGGGDAGSIQITSSENNQSKIIILDSSGKINVN